MLREFLLLGTCAVLLAACAGPTTLRSVPSTELVIPRPPATARIRCLYTYRGTMDLEYQRSFWKRMWHAVVGEDHEHLSSPYGIAPLANGAVLVADAGRALVHRIDPLQGRHEILRGDEDHPLVTPIGVAVDPSGRTYVSDSSRRVVVVFDAEDHPVAEFGGEGLFQRPTGMVYDPRHDRLLVADSVACEIVVLDRSGEVLRRVGERGKELGKFNFPTNLCLLEDGRLLVTDTLNFRVQVLGEDFAPLRSIGVVGNGPGCFAQPKGVAADSEGHVYVVDGIFDNVQIFDQEGRLLLVLGGPGQDFGEFALPTGLAIDSEDRIHVADSANGRIHVFQYLREDSP